MVDRYLEEELAFLRQEYEKGVNPSLLVRARSLLKRCQQVQYDMTDFIVEIVRHSPVRLSLRAIMRSQESGLPAQVTSDIVADLRRTIDRIDAAEINLLMGLGEIAQRIAHEETVYRSGMSQVHSKFKTFICTPVNSQIDPATISEARSFFEQPGRIAKSLGIEYLEQPNKLVLSIGYSEDLEAATQPIKIECVSLGRLALENQVIEAAMEAAASKVQNVICHEFYVDDAEFFIVLLSLA